MTFQEFVSDILLSDVQFGTTFTDLQMAHQIKIAVDSDPIELSETLYKKLRDVMEHPTKGYNPGGALQLMPFFQAINNAK